MTNIVNGVAVVCEDGVCRLVDAAPDGIATMSGEMVRMAYGYMDASAFISFLSGGDVASSLGELSAVAVVLTLFGGLALNLTPCVLPMAPVSLMVIGRSAKRGLLYGIGIASVYGLLGLLASFGMLAFGALQSNPIFNLVVAMVFVALGLALLGVWNAGVRATPPAWLRALKGPWLALAFGAMSALLAGACVAPVLMSTLVLSAKLYGEGNGFALALPFVLGVGMALPWPFLGAGLKVLPKPGGWMRWVNRVFAVVVFAFAAWYGSLAWRGWMADAAPIQTLSKDGAISATPATFSTVVSSLDGEAAEKPLLVDCWATWCKNCVAMDRVLEKPAVKAELGKFTLIKLQAEDVSELRKLPGFESVIGLPAFAIFDKKEARIE